MINSSDCRDPVEELSEDFLDALRRGETATVEEYAARYPEWADRIRALFPTLMMLEQLKLGDSESASETQKDRWAEELSHGVLRFGDFFITREIGRGGMGVVYAALQRSLERRVAFKVMAPGLFNSASQVSRFQREARAAANLHHTNIIPVFGYGEQDGVHYYVMQYIEGEGLDEILRNSSQAQGDRPLQGDWKRIAQCGIQLASALQYAHEQGVLHRDIKPANLLLDKGGTVWISDFGLAKAVWQDEITSPGDAVGTLRYMSPEQLDGEADARSDIYSLGLTLYELLACRPAFDGQDRGKLVSQIAQASPSPPRDVNPAIPVDLETIVLKAIERDRGGRYQTAEELAADLRRFVEDQPIRARRVSLAGQLWRWSKRNPAVAALGSSTLVLGIVVAIVAFIGIIRTREALSRESQHRRQTVVAHDRAITEQQRAAANLQLALTAFDEIAYDLALGKEPPAQAVTIPAGSEPRILPMVSHDAAVVLEKLVKFYEAFAENNSDHAPLQRQLVTAHRRLGDIHCKLARFDDAEVAYRRALELCCSVADTDCHAPSDQMQKASLCVDLGFVFLTVGRFSEAEKALVDAHSKLSAYLKTSPDSADANFELAKVHKQLSDLSHGRGEIEKWGEHNQKAITILEQLVSVYPRHADYRFHLARSYHNRPPFRGHGDGQSHAFAGHEDAIKLLTELAQQHPDVPKYRFELSKVYGRVHLWRPGRWQSSAISAKELKQAERRLRKALMLSRDLVLTYPSVPDHVAALGSNLRKMGTVMDLRGDQADAEQFFRRAVTRLEALVNRYENVPTYCDSLAVAKHALGRLLCHQGRFAEAEPFLLESLECRYAFLRVVPKHRRSLGMLIDQYRDLSLVMTGLDHKSRAAEYARQSTALRASLWPNLDAGGLADFSQTAAKQAASKSNPSSP